MYYYGGHMGIDFNNIISSLKEIKKMGGNFCQFFITKHLHKNVSKISDNQFNSIKKYLLKNNMKLVIHSSYMLNFANEFNLPPKKISWWINNLINEMKYASKMGAIGCIIHLGKHKELKPERGILNMYKSLKYVINNTPFDIKLIIETSCGQGTELCYKIPDLIYFYNLFSSKEKQKIGFCIDTCHIFAAGYKINTNIGILNFFKEIKQILDKVVLFHLNDSKNKVESHLDRHEILGKGFIGLENLQIIIKKCYELGIPLILETPSTDYTDEINFIKNVI